MLYEQDQFEANYLAVFQTALIQIRFGNSILQKITFLVIRI